MRDLALGEVSEVFELWANEMKIPVRDIMFTMIRDVPNEITIYTDRPGLMIGKCGSLVEKYKTLLNEKVAHHNHIIDICNEKYSRNEKHMPDVKINFIEVTRADFWLHYDPMSEGF